ncbi:MAG: hypothetical protein LC776_19080 [Acidobacteria bacterium]|nr:hypothetical protein [Acidobacteriota bacterium]
MDVVELRANTNLPSPLKTWEVSKLYIVKPFEKRGELDQGILRFTWYSLVLVAKGYALAILLGTPLGLLLGLGSRSPSEVRINGLGEGRSLYRTMLSGGLGK